MKPGDLTRVILNTDALDAIGHIRETRQAGNEPAITQSPLLDVARQNVLHESGFLKDFVDTFNCLWNIRRRITKFCLRKIEHRRGQWVESVPHLPFEIPVLENFVLVSHIQSNFLHQSTSQRSKRRSPSPSWDLYILC